MPALIDSGNVFRSALSKEAYIGLGGCVADLKKATASEVTTAAKGATLRVLGEPRQPLQLEVPQLKASFAFRPVIIEGLTMPCNISGPCMKEMKWDHYISKDALKINGHLVQLHPDLEVGQPEQTGWLEETNDPPRVVATIGKVKLGPQHASMLTVAAIDNPPLKPGLYTYSAPNSAGGNELTDDIVENGLVEVDKKGRARIPVRNDHEGNTKVFPDTLIVGTLQPVKLLSWSEAVMSVAAQTKKQKDKQDLLEYALRQKKEGSAKDKISPKLRKIRMDSLPKEEKVKWLIEHFKLNESPFLKTPERMKKATDLLLRYWDMMSFDGDFGKTDRVQHRIITEPGTKPIKDKYRPMPPHLEQDFKRQLDEWLELGCIEPSESPWSANLVVVKKKNGKPRYCVDWRGLNFVTKKDSFPMPLVSACLHKMAGAEIYSAIDMQGAFGCIEIAKEDREKTAFATPFGLYQQVRLGFGLCNGPPSFQRLTANILEDVPEDKAVGFMDDCLIHSKNDLDVHCDNLAMVLDRYRDAGLKLAPDKCTFFAASVDYLGHRIDKNGIRPMESHVDTVRKWELPKTKTAARAFLGLCGYYRDHVKDYAAITKPWTDVTGKTTAAAEKEPIHVTEDMKKAFEELKKRLTSAPVLGYAYFHGPKAGRFILDTDFCKDQIAGILSQRQPDGEKVIAYASKKLTGAQCHYPSTKGELYAGMYFMNKFRYYLAFAPEKFLWRTDNVALKYIHSMKTPSGILQRWLGNIADFDFEVEHRKAANHKNADSLSRFGYAPEEKPDASNQKGIDSLDITFTPRQLFTHSKGEMVELQKEDEDLAEVRKWVQQGKAPDQLATRALSMAGRHYAGIFESLHIDTQGLLKYTHPNQEFLPTRSVTCLPKTVWEDTIRLAHVIGGHMAGERTLERLKSSVFFPGMSAEVSSFVEACLTCQTKGRGPKPQRHTAVPVMTGTPFSRWHIDFVGPLNESRRTGAKWILVAKDAFSKWVVAVPMKAATAEATMRALEKEIFAVFGYPTEIHSDMGAQFTSNLYNLANTTLGIKVTHTTGYHPAGNGMVERVNRDLGNILRALMKDDPSSWEDVLPQALFALRTAVSRTTGLSPYNIIFGRDVSQPLDLIFGQPEDYVPATVTTTSAQEYAHQLRKRIRRAQEYVRQNLAKAVKRQRRLYHQEKKHFLPGTKVLLFTPKFKIGIPAKFTSMYTGPWRVTSDNPVNAVTVRIAPDPGWTKGVKPKGSIVVSIDRLKVFKDGDPVRDLEEDDDLLMEGDEFAEHLRLQEPPPYAPPALGAAPQPGGGGPPPGQNQPGGPQGGLPPGGPQGPNPPGGPPGPNQPGGPRGGRGRGRGRGQPRGGPPAGPGGAAAGGGQVAGGRPQRQQQPPRWLQDYVQRRDDQGSSSSTSGSSHQPDDEFNSAAESFDSNDSNQEQAE